MNYYELYYYRMPNNDNDSMRSPVSTTSHYVESNDLIEL